MDAVHEKKNENVSLICRGEPSRMHWKDLPLYEDYNQTGFW